MARGGQAGHASEMPLDKMKVDGEGVLVADEGEAEVTRLHSDRGRELVSTAIEEVGGESWATQNVVKP